MLLATRAISTLAVTRAEDAQSGRYKKIHMQVYNIEDMLISPGSCAHFKMVAGEFLLWHCGLRIQLQWLRLLWKHRFDPWPSAVG